MFELVLQETIDDTFQGSPRLDAPFANGSNRRMPGIAGTSQQPVLTTGGSDGDSSGTTSGKVTALTAWGAL
jgi:hypothetical protein